MEVEVYHASFVPTKVPEFVDSHITQDSPSSYLIEVDPNHPYLQSGALVGLTTIKALESFGFRGLELIYRGNKPSF